MSGRSSCPECGTILRIRDRSFVGRKFHCPECKTALKVDATDRDDQYIASRVASSSSASVNTAVKVKAKPQGIPKVAGPKRTSINRILHSPLTVGLLLVMAVAALIAVLTLNPRFRVFTGPSAPILDLPETPFPPDQSAEPKPVEIVEITAQPAPDSVGPVFVGVDLSQALSALEPANVDGPLPWPPVEVAMEPVEPPPPPPKVDVEGKLAQKIFSYKQPKVTRRNLLDSLEEQLGAPIRYDIRELGADKFDQKVSFELENTTIGDVIRHVASAADWQMEIEATGIRLVPSKPTPDP